MRIYLSSDEHNAAERAAIAILSKWTSEDKVKAREQKYQELTKCPKCMHEISWGMSLNGGPMSGQIYREINCRCDCDSYKYTDSVNSNANITSALDDALKVLSKEIAKINGTGLIYEGSVYK